MCGNAEARGLSKGWGDCAKFGQIESQHTEAAFARISPSVSTTVPDHAKSKKKDDEQADIGNPEMLVQQSRDTRQQPCRGLASPDPTTRAQDIGIQVAKVGAMPLETNADVHSTFNMQRHKDSMRLKPNKEFWEPPAVNPRLAIL